MTSGALLLPAGGLGLAGVAISGAWALAKGFGAAKKAGGDDGGEGIRKATKGLRGKILPCDACRGSGKKPCQFCRGTKLMKGFMNTTVPCVPCQQTGTLGRPCPECSGMGYFTP